MNESLITIRVPKELKERMKRARINWSEEMREAIKTKLGMDQKRNSDEELERILASVTPGFDSSRAIKEARRHG